MRHAFRVARGSIRWCWEPQILGQVKQSVRTAENVGALFLLGAFSSRRSGRKVRSETALGAQSTHGGRRRQAAQGVFGDLSRTACCWIGVGEMVELAATYFVAAPLATVVANRTLARGEARRAFRRYM